MYFSWKGRWRGDRRKRNRWRTSSWKTCQEERKEEKGRRFVGMMEIRISCSTFWFGRIYSKWGILVKLQYHSGQWLYPPIFYNMDMELVGDAEKILEASNYMYWYYWDRGMICTLFSLHSWSRGGSQITGGEGKHWGPWRNPGRDDTSDGQTEERLPHHASARQGAHSGWKYRAIFREAAQVSFVFITSNVCFYFVILIHLVYNQ